MIRRSKALRDRLSRSTVRALSQRHASNLADSRVSLQHFPDAILDERRHPLGTSHREEVSRFCTGLDQPLDVLAAHEEFVDRQPTPEAAVIALIAPSRPEEA
jgi:hypothetical protein